MFYRDMHERKAKMASLANAFIAMPGGYGTMEELFEVVTWQQLGFHDKPVGVLNIDNFYNPLLAFVAHASSEGFISPRHNNIILSHSDPVELLEKCQKYVAPESRVARAKRTKSIGDNEPEAKD